MPNRIKIILSTILVSVIFLNCYCFAASPKVQLNGQIIDFSDENGNKVEAQIINSRTMVPLRKIFELLKCNIEWQDVTKTVVANNGSKEITIQIGNSEAKVFDVKSQKASTIKLDSPATIVEGRTLVPLRFISESLEKEVAWDNANSTAIIIDYDFLATLLKEKNKEIYNRLIKGDIAITVEKKYFDEVNSSRNEDSSFKTTITNSNEDNFDGNYKFDGNSEFIKEVKNEEWDSIDFSVEESGEGIFVKSPNYVFSNMLSGKKNDKILLDNVQFNFAGSTDDDVSQYLKKMVKLKNSEIDINTFKSLKSDFEKLLNTFLVNGTRKLSVEDFNYKYIELGKIYSLLSSDKTFSALLIANKAMFNYNINVDDLFADYPNISYTVSSSENTTNIKIILKNDYKERIEYSVVL